MRASLKHAVAWLPALAAAAAIPPPTHRACGRSQPQDDVKPVVLELDAQNARATFSVPCQACLGADDDESLVFDLQVFPSDQPCGEANITLNGQQLIQEWSGNRAEGSGFISSANRATADHEPGHDIALSWDTLCLFEALAGSDASEYGDDVAQLLTVSIRKVDDRAIHHSAGFSVSFKQAARKVDLLRLATSPVSLSDAQEGQDWRDPPADLRLVSVNFDDLPEGFFHQSASVEDEIEILRELEADEKRIQERIRQQKQIIRQHMRENSHSLRDELNTCDSLSCIFSAFLHKAHGAVRIIYVHLSPGPHHHHGGDMDREHFPSYQGHPEQAFADIDTAHPPSPHAGHPVMKFDHHPPGPPPPFDGHPFDGPGGYGPPPPPPSPSGFGGPYGQGPPPPPPPPFDGPGDRGPLPPPPPPPPPHHHDGPRPVHGVLIAFASLTGLACIFSFIRRNCCSLRQRTERRATREERRTARQYRRLARRHAWKKWWTGSEEDRDRRGDYDEKRALILDQENRLEEAMQEEIRHLRAAHELAHDIVQAEQGRASPASPSSSGPSTCPCMNAHAHSHVHTHPHMQPLTQPPHIAHGMYAPPPSPPHVMSRTSSLPSYKSDLGSVDTDDAPPAYEEDADSSDIVVDGFHEYTPSVTTGFTPESSIPDVSPRPSFDTMRDPPEPDTAESESLDRDRKN